MTGASKVNEPNRVLIKVASVTTMLCDLPAPDGDVHEMLLSDVQMLVTHWLTPMLIEAVPDTCPKLVPRTDTMDAPARVAAFGLSS